MDFDGFGLRDELGDGFVRLKRRGSDSGGEAEARHGSVVAEHFGRVSKKLLLAVISPPHIYIWGAGWHAKHGPPDVLGSHPLNNG